MFKITKTRNENLSTLELTKDLFHEAYNKGETSYHVKNDKYDFYIAYVDNDSIVPETYKKMYASVGITEVLPKYRRYDENNIECISFALFDHKNNIAFDEVNEYSIVMAKVLIDHNYNVYFTDELIYAFIKSNDNMHIVENIDNLDKKSTCFIKNVDGMFMTDNNDNVNYILAFHNMFFLQDFIDKNIKDIKYIKIKISSVNGIGIIPIYLKKLNDAFSIYNIKIILDPTGTRYSVKFLCKVFDYQFLPSDMNDKNTIYLDNISKIMLTYFYIKSDDKYGYEVFNPSFKDECDSFLHSTIDSKKSLGLLIRGTDYISTNVLNEKRMAPIDYLLPMIEKWINDDRYEAIFLATEDQDVLEKLKNIYGDKLYYIDQKRFKASEFKSGQTIADREKEKYTKDEYQDNVDDTTAKYLKALYVLSKCDALICSGMCNGYQVVKSLNNGRYKKEYIYKGVSI